MPGRSLPKKILAIDWDARTLRVVHAFLSKRGVKIDRIFSTPIPAEVDSASPEQMGRHIRTALEQEGIATKHAIVDIPRDQAILKTLTLPPADPEEMAGIVQIQIAKELPFPVDGAVIDFTMGAPGEKENTNDVLVAAVRYELRDQYAATFATAGLKLDRIGLRPYANKVAICRLLQFSLPERVLFIDVRPTLTEIDLLRHGALAFSRAASVVIPLEATLPSPATLGRDETGGKGSRLALRLAPDALAPAGGDMADPRTESSPAPLGARQQAVQALVMEVTRSIEAYRATDPGANIDHVVIGGDIGIEEELGEAIQSRLGISTEIYNPASSFGWEPDEGAAASAFASTLGLVLGHVEAGGLHFDFLHPKRASSAAQRRWRKAPALVSIGVLFMAAAALGVTQYRKEDRQTLARIEAKIQELKGNETENKKFEALMRNLRAFDAGQHLWVDVLYEVFAQLPSNEQMVVHHIDMNQELGRVVLKTKTKDRDTPTEIIRKLHEFRREGRELPRFKATMGPQAEKKGEEYPFAQDLRVWVLNDEGSTKKLKKKDES